MTIVDGVATPLKLGQLKWTYSGTSLLRSPMGLSNCDLNGEVTILQGAKFIYSAVWNTIFGTEQG